MNSQCGQNIIARFIRILRKSREERKCKKIGTYKFEEKETEKGTGTGTGTGTGDREMIGTHWHIYVTGHSLGGALATLFSFELGRMRAGASILFFFHLY